MLIPIESTSRITTNYLDRVMKIKVFLILLLFGIIALGNSASAGWDIVSPSPTTLDLKSVHYLLASTDVYSAGNTGVGIKSTDNGTSWAAMNTGLGVDLHSIYFPSTSIGYYCGNNGSIYKTTNSGSSWVEQSSGITVHIFDLHFSSVNHGVACGALGKVYYTINGGTNWNEVSSGVNTDLHAVYLVDANYGFVCGIGGKIIKTTNGGQSWSQTTSGTSTNFKDIYFVNNLVGYVVGDGGSIMKTSNGNHWGFLASGTNANLSGVCFTTNQSQGYAVGDNGTILYTSNSGNNWGNQTSASSNNLYSISFKNNLEGIIVGAHGLIMKTLDGGGASSSPYVLLNHPNGGEYFHVGNTTNITWSASSSVATIKLTWGDGTLGHAETLATVDASLGTWSWTIPNRASSSCWMKIEDASDPLLHDNANGPFTISPTGITVSQPNTDLHWQVGSTQSIIWTMNNVSAVDIDYSTNNGVSWVSVATNVTSSPYSWASIPDTPSDQCMIRISSSANASIYDESDDLFVIADIDITSPAAGSGIEIGQSYNIEWTSDYVDIVNVVYSTDGVNFPNVIASDITATVGTTSWTVPVLAVPQVHVRVYDKDYDQILDEVTLNVLIHEINLVKPNGSEHLLAGSNYSIDWTSTNVNNIDIEFSSDGTTYTSIVTGEPASNASYIWTVPATYSETCLIKLIDSDYNSVLDGSAAYFTIADIEITAPIDGTALVIGDAYDIDWDYENVEFVKIEYSTDGQTFTTITAAVDATLGTYSWTPTGITANSILLRILDAAYPTIFDIISLDIHIPGLTLSSPVGGEYWRTSSVREITWSADYVDDIDIYFSSTGATPASWTLLASDIDASLGEWSWTTPAGASSNCFIKIESSSNPALNDVNSTAFTLTPNYIEVLSPNGGEQWDYNSMHNITWISLGVTNVDILYSTDGGATWVAIADASNIPAAGGFHSWRVPKMPSAQCLIRVHDNAINAIFDDSDAIFEIAAVKLLTPNGAEDILINNNYSITWESNLVDNLDFYYSTDGGVTWNMIEANYPASAPFYSWSVPNTPSTNYLVKALDSKKSSIADTSDAVFKVSGIVLTTPNGAEEYVVGRTYDITWESANVSNVKIEYSIDKGTNWVTIISNTATAPKSYSWKIPKTPSELCLVRISDVADATTIDESNEVFTILGQGITLTNPTGGGTWTIGTSYAIIWESININFVNIQLSRDGGRNWTNIGPASIDASLGTYTWAATAPASTECLVRITDVSNPLAADQSATQFKIGGVEFTPPTTWEFTTMTGMSSTIIVPHSIAPLVGGRDIQTSDAIGLFFDDEGTWRCAGYAIWQNSTNLAITVWGNNSRTTAKDGYNINEEYVFKVWDAQTGTELFAQAKFSSGFSYFTDNGISILSGLRSHIEFDISLQGGAWSLISSYLLPANNNIENMMSGVIDEFDYMKDDEGQIYYPSEDINTIQNWEINKGYQIYMNEDATLTVMGSNIDPFQYCMQITGMSWYIISYLPDTPLSIDSALYSLRGNILLVKDMYGNIYYPAYGIDQIVTMRPGQGYKIILYNIDTLCYPENSKYSPRFLIAPTFLADSKYNCDISGTGSNSTLVVNSANSELNEKMIEQGDEIAVFNSSGLIIGCGKVGYDKTTMTIWGDNSRTSPEVEGALMNEELEIKVWDKESNNEYSLEIVSGADLISGKPLNTNPKYQSDGIWLLNATKGKLISSVDTKDHENDFNISISPNPAQERVVASINSASSGKLQLRIMSLTGNEVYSKAFGQITTGLHTYDLNISELKSGVYLLVAEIDGMKATEKIVVIK
jgi:photosystem II stability/assembly factor-like uncharacterized protein